MAVILLFCLSVEEEGAGSSPAGVNYYTNQEYARGAFKIVYKGKYKSGPREGQDAAVKVFATGGVYEDSFFKSEMDVIEKSMQIIDQFNSSQIIDRHIYLNQPSIWRFTGNNWEGQKCLVEPFILNFQKFNSNSGWRDQNGTPWVQVMQALSHFSYHVSGGNFLLCDLQGGIYSDGAVLTDPVVMSEYKQFGPTDLGRNGILTFFSNHSCSQYCRSQWTKPHNPKAFFPINKGTSMIEVPTRDTRTPLTHHFSFK